MPSPSTTASSPPAPHRGTPLEVFLVFLQLGLSAFGGPSAHIGYFRTAFVERRAWLDDAHFSELLALTQLLPGPSSSQLGMALGQHRAGRWGALAAWLGFTLPSALLMILLGVSAAQWQGAASAGWLHGLKIAAVAVVAHAVVGMARSLCRGPLPALTAVMAALVMWTVPGQWAQWLAIGLGALVGQWLRSTAPAMPATPAAPAIASRAAVAALIACLLLLIGLPWLASATGSPWLQAISVFYRSGALVFGGGHVVLPLLHQGVVEPGWVSPDLFLSGYGAAQALPGPLFAFGGFLGAVLPAPCGGWFSGVVMLVALFAPGALLMLGALPFWTAWRQHPRWRGSVAGINAAVVGQLAAALVRPIGLSAITGLADLALAVLAFGLLLSGRVRPLLVLALAAAAGGMWVMR